VVSLTACKAEERGSIPPYASIALMINRVYNVVVNKYFKRMVYRSEGVKVPFLIYPFLLITFAPGVAFVAFSNTTAVQASVLFTLTSVHLGILGVSLWGTAAMLAVVLALINIVARKRWAGRTAPMLGSMVWIYALIVFGVNHFYFQMFASAIPNLCFWAWHYIRVEGYWRNFLAGNEDE
jgi:hypothetical protein